ncbi:Ig-like domain-containing protein [Rhodococcus oxybenzonivorans]|uniref:Ig-like domain-containing protein n=1 Tax=Rhodococcus TaxID=1827 RepID=UPI001F28E9AA|nr:MULTISPECIES: Ig-like domain-containing protein [Rhodococcus]MDV7352282.1 Ig-like domain-containing protein [Rhodococcus oxybenzonivorans]
MFTLGAAATAMVLAATPAAAVATTTTVAVQGVAATTCQVTLTATVAPPPMGGTVQFKDGNVAIGAAAAVAANGTASINHTFNTAGAHVITAKFSGVTGFDASMSANVTVNVGMGLNLGSICLPIG